MWPTSMNKYYAQMYIDYLKVKTQRTYMIKKIWLHGWEQNLHMWISPVVTIQDIPHTPSNAKGSYQDH